MSVQAATNIASTAAESHKKPKDKSSKKRKHQDADEDKSTKKKRRHAVEAESDAKGEAVGSVEKNSSGQDREEKKRKKEQKRDTQEKMPQPEVALANDSEKKRRKREKQKDKHRHRDSELSLSDSSLQDKIQSSDPPKSNETEKKRRKKKDVRVPEPEPEPESESDLEPESVPPAQPVTNGAVSDDDIELPDAPVVDAPQASLSAVSGETEPELEAVTEDILQIEEESLGVDFLTSPDPSCFYSTRLSLYVPVPAITLPEHAKKAVLSMHLSPLLLTYFPPAKGMVMAFENAVLSARAGNSINLPLKEPTKKEAIAQEKESAMQEILAQTSDQFGVAWVWLTVTLLVFRPQKGDEMYGWNNIASEGFVGLVSYNYFQASVGSSRVPSEWKWRGPTNEQRKRKKGRMEKMLEDGRRDQSSPTPSSSVVVNEQTREEIQGESGFFGEDNQKVPETLKYRVVDTDMVPGGEKGKWSMQIDATLLDEDKEKEVVEEERAIWERMRARKPTLGVEMSGALGRSREASVISAVSSTLPRNGP